MADDISGEISSTDNAMGSGTTDSLYKASSEQLDDSGVNRGGSGASSFLRQFNATTSHGPKFQPPSGTSHLNPSACSHKDPYTEPGPVYGSRVTKQVPMATLPASPQTGSKTALEASPTASGEAFEAQMWSNQRSQYQMGKTCKKILNTLDWDAHKCEAFTEMPGRVAMS
jgi:hypothetical protein